MHPARATRQTWNYALDEAVENGLNLITIYVMWSDHQPLPDKPIDWTFSDWDWDLSQKRSCRDTINDKSCDDWNLAAAIQAAGNRGLFVHVSILDLPLSVNLFDIDCSLWKSQQLPSLSLFFCSYVLAPTTVQNTVMVASQSGC